MKAVKQSAPRVMPMDGCGLAEVVLGVGVVVERMTMAFGEVR
jgi:hypothetical protein